MFIFDEINLFQTAEVVIEVNSFARDKTAKEMVAIMKKTAEDVGPGFGYISEYGYTLSCFTDNGREHVRASVNSYVVLEYLKKNNK